MKRALKSLLAIVAAAGAAGSLAGCASNSHANKPTADDVKFDDFGRSVRQDIAAQIADPDPVWKKDPPPPSSGKRANLAQKRYEADAVAKSSVTTTTIGSQSSESGGSTGP